MNTQTKVKIGFLLVMIMFFAWPESVSAHGRFGVSLGGRVRGPVGVHASTHGGVGVSLPTPEVSVDAGGVCGVSATADPGGVRANFSGPNGVSAGASSDGDFYGGVSEGLPGGSFSGRVDEGGVSGDVMVDDL